MMLRHMLKLVWKRKTRNLMLSLEIMLAFALVFGIAAYAVRSAQLYKLPMGFEYADAWSIYMQRPEGEDRKPDPEVYRQLRDAARALPEVEDVSFAQYPPFWGARSEGGFVFDGGADVRADHVDVDDHFQSASGLKIVDGRWFTEADARPGHQPVLLNQRMAKAMFGDRSPVGQHLTQRRSDRPVDTIFDIMGVFVDYRYEGNFTPPRNVILRRFDVLTSEMPARAMIVKLKPGVPRAFESRLVETLKRIQGNWDFNVTPQDLARSDINDNTKVPLIFFSIVASFMLVMVGGGLFGVIWQQTARRTSEIGLRRAVGASPGDIYGQIIGEQLLLSTLAVLAALLLLVQVPLTGAFSDYMNWTVFLAAAAIASLVIYLLSFACAVYPGWRASRLTPTEALHYE